MFIYNMCRMICRQRSAMSGDTIVEVVLAFTIFTLLSISVVAIMNKGINMADRSIEITLIREQIDAEAEILRYAEQTNSAAWQAIRSNLGTADDATSGITDCPTASELGGGSFIANISDTGDVVRTQLSANDAIYSATNTYSSFSLRGTPSARGIWVIPVAVEGATDTFDMYIRTCWTPAGSSRAETLGTIVRIYDAPAIVVSTPPPTPSPVCNVLDNYSNNLIVNGTFSTLAGDGPSVDPAAGFSSDLPNRGYNVYPDDAGLNGTSTVYTGGFSLQNGNHWYGTPLFPNSLYAQSFPGDIARGVPASNTYFYSNPNQRVDDPPGTIRNFSGVLWRQTVAVQPNATYDFSGYFDNILLTTQVGGVDPRIQLRADGDPLMSPVTILRDPDTYQRVTLVFTTGPSQTSVTLDIYDYANDISGDDFGMTALALRRCI